MSALDEYLIRRGDGLVLLFTPPFDHSDVDPGYIKGYLPGIRENGGQYTHGAIWSVLAFAALGDGDKAGELFAILNPINHASTRAGVHRYKVEPYVMAADVYSEPPHVGRGGWTWYTGSAGWMYQAGVEWILGFRLRGTTLILDPCIPRAWPGFEIDLPLPHRRVRDRRGEPARSQPWHRVGRARWHRPHRRLQRHPAGQRRRHSPREDRSRIDGARLATGQSFAAPLEMVALDGVGGELERLVVFGDCVIESPRGARKDRRGRRDTGSSCRGRDRRGSPAPAPGRRARRSRLRD